MITTPFMKPQGQKRLHHNNNKHNNNNTDSETEVRRKLHQTEHVSKLS